MTKIEELDERLDYVLFHFKVETLPRLPILRLAGADYLSLVAKDGYSRVGMLGYPFDKYAAGLLTHSYCDVRSGAFRQKTGENEGIRATLIAAWESDANYHAKPNYEKMRQDCQWYLDWIEHPGFSHAFQHDCSTYGGNSQVDPFS